MTRTRQRRGFARSRGALFCVVVWLTTAWPSQADQGIEDLSLEELMRVRVATASGIESRLDEAPATLIVIDRHQIAQRGVSDLSELLADLPGMDFVRPFGATYLKNYWRGFRNNIGAPYLLLLDGVVLNHLYFNSADVMMAIPLSSIERVEVVYGPASSVYGPNAFMGVIQIVTRRGEDYATARGELGEHSRTGFDGAASGSVGPWRWSLAARRVEGILDPSTANRTTYTQEALLQDRRLWGGFLDDSTIAGRFESPERFTGIDLRLERDGLEVAAHGFQTMTGYGVEYALDQSQNDARWIRDSAAVHARYTREWTPRVTSISLARYRTSDVDDGSTFVEGFVVDVAGEPERRIDFSRWRASNHSLLVHQDFKIDWSDRLALSVGTSYERKSLQKAYEVAFGPSLPPEQVVLNQYPFPDRKDIAGPGDNRTQTSDFGLYVQSQWRQNEHHTYHLGLRRDDNSAYGSEVTLRAGYVGSWGPWIAKVLYGEAFQEPNPRVLYGGWRGSGSDPELAPERSRTAEASLSYTRHRVRHHLSLYSVENHDTINNFFDGAANLGDRSVFGMDYHFEALPEIEALDELRLWGYYTHLFEAEEEHYSPDRHLLGSVDIGDIARDQLTLGITAQRLAWTSTVSAHWVDHRATVASNPVRSIPSYTTANLYLRYRLPFAHGLAVGLKATNLFDEEIFHPGVREASAGEAPGGFDSRGQWVGAAGFYNSLLPQPGRQLSFVVTFDR
ncbi:MAG: TonB-dependent receptor [Thermoanaerobaculia bacterium]|nr:TonB-dependent receptor [Thermoanaerobaculia bacterium]